MIRVTVLGSGGSAGVPLIGGADGRGDWGACDPEEPRNRRSRSSIIVEANGTVLLVDTSPDLRTQLLANAVVRVDAVLYTHAHADHVVGLDDLRIVNRILGRPLEVFGTAATLAEIRSRFPYAFLPWEHPGFFRPVLEPRIVVPGTVSRIGAIDLLPIDQDHGFSRSLGFRVGGFAYTTDVVALDETTLALLAGIDTWMIGCFQRRRHSTHAWLERVLDWITRVRPRRAVLTHMGFDMDWGWMAAHLPAGVEPACDGMVIDLPG